jgi:hypothetical protein
LVTTDLIGKNREGQIAKDGMNADNPDSTLAKFTQEVTPKVGC